MRRESEFSQSLWIMVFCRAVYRLCAAESTAVYGDRSPAVFAGAGNGVSFNIAVGFFGGKLDYSTEILALCHEKLMMRLNIIFLYGSHSHSAGKSNALRHIKIRLKIHNTFLVFFYTFSVIAFQRIIEKIEDYFLLVLRDFFKSVFALRSESASAVSFHQRDKLTLSL